MVDNQLRSVKEEVHKKEIFINFMNPLDRGEIDRETYGVTNELAILEKEVRNHYKRV